MIVSERLPSARFFFNLISDAEMIQDEKGIDLPLEGDLVSHIARALEELHQDEMLASAEWQGWKVVITDFSGQTLFSVALGDPSVECALCPLN
jgi:hypothetical protein